MSKTTLSIRRSDGRIFSIDDLLWRLTAVSGLDKPNIEIYTQKAAIGAGDLITGERVGSRAIDITATTRKPELNDVSRRAATSFFTPGRTYDVYVTRYGSQRYAADCRLDSIEIPTDNQYSPITLKLSLLCPEGYFLSADSFGKNIAGVTERAGWPYVALSGYGRICGVYAYAGTVYLDNDGDAEAYCKAVFIAKGSVVNPKLIAGNGYVRVLCTMADGDVLLIDGKTKSVTLNGVNAATMLDKASSFSGIVFGLGTNSIGYTADVGSNVLAVNVYYNKRYMGA
ncbi:MAG: phage tail family protein [Candidatus Limiplasma sp.]|nr:phage tail family protein [Candidatus Limiplasma sp.]